MKTKRRSNKTKHKCHSVNLIYKGYDPVFDDAVMQLAEKYKLGVTFYNKGLYGAFDTIINVSIINSRSVFMRRLSKLVKELTKRRYNRRKKEFTLWAEPSY